MYNKIFTKILDSSIWMEPLPTRIVWLTFIAAMDEHGFVEFASAANVAHRAIVPLEDTVKALAVLEGPDPNSSDPENDGRRLERVPGGWIVRNATKYRDLVTRAVRQERTRERVRAHRAKRCNAPVTLCNAPVTLANASVTQSEADTEALSDAVSKTNANTRARATPPDQVTDADHWRMKVQFDSWTGPLKAAQCKIGPQNWRAWESLVQEYGCPVVLSAAKGLSARDRWPDAVADTLTASRGQQNPGDAIAHKIKRITL